MLIQALLEIQRTHQWNDQQMAATLGISRAQWNQIKRGTYRHSQAGFVVKAIRAFPQLQGKALDYVQQSDSVA